MKEPLWRTILNWGAVIVFLLLPLFLLGVQLYAWSHPGALQIPPNETHLKYIQDFLRNTTLLVFGLSGLKTWETLKNGNAKK